MYTPFVRFLDGTLAELWETNRRFGENGESISCDSGLHVQSLLPMTAVLDDLALTMDSKAFHIEAGSLRVKAFEMRDARRKVVREEGLKTEEDMDRLAEPDFT